MEKITDNDLKAMLTKNEEAPKEIKNEETGEVQWTEISKEEAKEAFNKAIDATFDESSSLQEDLEQEIDFNTIPENIDNNIYEEKPLDPVLDNRKKLTIGLTPEDIQALFDYIAGKGEKPLFVDKFMSDTEGRLKEMTSIMTLIQLSQIPTLTAYRNQLMERLFAPENLYDMDSKTLSSTMSNISSDIMKILDTSIKNVQTVSQFGSLNNEYRRLLDGMMMLPTDKLEEIHKLVGEAEINNLEK